LANAIGINPYQGLAYDQKTKRKIYQIFCHFCHFDHDFGKWRQCLTVVLKLKVQKRMIMYQLQDSVLVVKGVGSNLQKSLNEYQIDNILDLLLYLPLRYEDRSTIQTIAQIKTIDPVQTALQTSSQNKKVKVNFVTTKAKISSGTSIARVDY
jgi:hypothetical protein